MFLEDHLATAYDYQVPVNAHKLACVFFVMALGYMFDLDREPCESLQLRSLIPDDARGDRLFALGKTCLSAVSMEHACPATVQAIHLCGTYLLNGDGKL